MSKMIDVPPIWLCGFLALAYGQAAMVPIHVFGPVGDIAGGMFVFAGVLLALLAVREFARARTSVIPHKMPSAIVTSGVFGISRNPIYLGDVFILVGLILWWDALPSLVLVPLFVLLLQRRFILAEETRLSIKFPEAFAAYSRQVGRWIGRK